MDYLDIMESGADALVAAYRLHPSDYSRIKQVVAKDERWRQTNQIAGRPPGLPTFFGIELYVDAKVPEGYPVAMTRRDVEEFLAKERREIEGAEKGGI